MEKYRKFADKATGRNPFLPLGLAKSNVLKRFILGPMIGLMKIPFVLVILLWLFLFACIIPTLLFIWPLRRLLQRYASLLGCRTLLLLFGFWNIKKIYHPFFEVAKNSFAFVGSNTAPPPTKDQPNSPLQLILCNYTSYVDILYLACRFSPVFAFPVMNEDGDEMSDRVTYCGLFTALARTSLSLDAQLKHHKKGTANKGIPLSTLLQKAQASHWGPVVFFPEGTTSNGKGILQWSTAIETLPDKICESLGVLVLGISYEDNKTFSPTVPINDGVYSHFWGCLTQIYNKMTVKELRKSEVPSMVKMDLDKWTDHVKSRMSAAIKAPGVFVGMEEKAEFLKMWAETQGTNYKKMQ